MIKEILHTPEGVRDVYGKECSRKLALEENLGDVFRKFGFHNIQTPTFEFFDVFNKERGSVPTKDLYKFFDREGNTLVLRPDVTPSICRSVAKYFTNDIVPVKLCYNQNTFINDYELQGKLKETTQMGCELIGDDSIEADAEIIVTVIESLKKSGLKEFLVEIGQVDFFMGLVKDCNLSEDDVKVLTEYISTKRFFGVEDYLEKIGLSYSQSLPFIKLPELFGQFEVLSLAKQITTNEISLAAIERLEKLYSILEKYDVTKYISFDLGMLGNYKYYTGIIFKAYTYGTGDAIVTGGRYDKLIKQFGKDSAAIGFGIYVDRLLFALNSQKVEFEDASDFEVIIYEQDKRDEAIELAMKLRSEGVSVDLMLKNESIDLDEYMQFKKNEGAIKCTYLK